MQPNFILITQQQFEDMAMRIATMAVHLAVASKDEYTRAEMQRKHGRGRINMLIKEGRLVPRRVEGTKRIVYSELQYQSLIN